MPNLYQWFRMFQMGNQLIPKMISLLHPFHEIRVKLGCSFCWKWDIWCERYYKFSYKNSTRKIKVLVFIWNMHFLFYTGQWCGTNNGIKYFIKKPVEKISSWNWFAIYIIHDWAQTCKSIPPTKIEAVPVKITNMFLYIQSNWATKFVIKIMLNIKLIIIISVAIHSFFATLIHQILEMFELLSLPIINIFWCAKNSPKFDLFKLLTSWEVTEIKHAHRSH